MAEEMKAPLRCSIDINIERITSGESLVRVEYEKMGADYGAKDESLTHATLLPAETTMDHLLEHLGDLIQHHFSKAPGDRVTKLYASVNWKEPVA